MPPANSPNDTRPSTPPPYTFPTTNSSLSSHPYLQQLEEAISTPVPDLASTLTTPESRPRTARRTNTTHPRDVLSDDAAGTINQLLRHHSPSPQSSVPSPRLPQPDFIEEQDSFRDSSEAQLQRVQSEVERWQNERERLRGILQSQEERQSVLEGENWRLREQRRRLRGERRRLWDGTGGGVSASQEARMEERQDEEIRWRASSLNRAARQQWEAESASTLAEVERRRRERRLEAQGYVDRMSASWIDTRESMRPGNNLLDEAAASGQDEEVSQTAADGEIDSGPRRELDRALRNYRAARNAMRVNRQPGTDLGTVPTASALRAYWNEEPEQVPQLPAPQVPVHGERTPFSLSEFVEQHRAERQRRAQQSEWRQQHMEWRARMQRNNQEHSASRETLRRPRTPEVADTTDAFMRVRNTIQYLSDLRTTTVQGSLEIARSLSIDTLYEYADTSTPSDLPMTIDALPQPQPSSWLKAGMTWQGLQSTDREPHRPTLLASTLRRMRQREYSSRAMARRGYTNDPNSQQSYRALQPIPPEETDRYLSYAIENPGLRWASHEYDQQMDAPRSGAGITGLENLSLVSPPERNYYLNNTGSSATGDADHWPVTVRLHEVNWDNMTISGTMRASQIPDRPHDHSEAKSMESFFQGEIIDFRNHTLLSDGQKLGYKVGEVDVDARYWARLGPFKQEIERATSIVVQPRKWDGKTKWGATPMQTEGAFVQSRAGVGQESMNDGYDSRRRDADAEEVMARCLGSEKWLREKVGGEWVLMRWKEKCFVDPIIAHPATDSSQSSSITPAASSEYPSSSTTLLGDRAQAQWGLTISGFYYVALHRQTGRIDGLYCDPGSQPYQSLRMAPEGCKLGEEEVTTSLSTARAKEVEDLGVGVKRWFPAIEMR